MTSPPRPALRASRSVITPLGSCRVGSCSTLTSLPCSRFLDRIRTASSSCGGEPRIQHAELPTVKTPARPRVGTSLAVVSGRLGRATFGR